MDSAVKAKTLPETQALAQPAGPDASPALDHKKADSPKIEPGMFDLIELFFFAYRDFVGDADRLLESIGFGRAHHRVLHFVYRQPGLTIAELLDILQITKQSLSRVLKELLDTHYVEARAGVTDRRQRMLFPTPKGHQLAQDLAMLQSRRFTRALGELPEGARAHAMAFLLATIDPQERRKVEDLLQAGATRGEP